MAERFRELGWESRLDRSGNVVASLPGRRESPTVAVTAHLDTVLAPRSSDEIKLSGDGRFLGPGVSDNGAGLAALLAIAAAWNAAPPLPDAQLAPVLIANVGEEGEGNLSGMRFLCREANGSRPKAFLVLDGPNTDHITCRALASRRFEVTVNGPGGHSWSDYGAGNPIHALSRAIAEFTAAAPDASSARSSLQLWADPGRDQHQLHPHGGAREGRSALWKAERIDEMASLLAASVAQAAEMRTAVPPAAV
jgi:acetylornithine deacetylase/succinyl-diaminopimelate desuccinylase-like protein